MNEFKEFERDAWEQKAPRYQSTWSEVTEQIIPRTLEVADLKAGEALLDCGCGPGHLSAQALKRGVSVLGCDYSREMIAIASKNYPEINFEHGDAEALAFNDTSFEVVICNYLFLHLSDQIKALREMYRVLKPGGRLIYTTWTAPEADTGLGLIFSIIKEFADTAVIPSGPDIFMLADPVEAPKILSEIGFCEFYTETFEALWVVKTGEDFFNAIQAGTRMGGMIDLQTPLVKEKMKGAVLTQIEKFKINDFEIPMRSRIVSIKKSI